MLMCDGAAAGRHICDVEKKRKVIQPTLNHPRRLTHYNHTVDYISSLHNLHIKIGLLETYTQNMKVDVWYMFMSVINSDNDSDKVWLAQFLCPSFSSLKWP